MSTVSITAGPCGSQSHCNQRKLRRRCHGSPLIHLPDNKWDFSIARNTSPPDYSYECRYQVSRQRNRVGRKSRERRTFGERVGHRRRCGGAADKGVGGIPSLRHRLHRRRAMSRTADHQKSPKRSRTIAATYHHCRVRKSPKRKGDKHHSTQMTHSPSRHSIAPSASGYRTAA